MPIDQLHKLFKNTSGICTDTRKIKKDNLFVALKGENFNGNKFAKQALESGAKYVMIDEEEYFQSKENTISVPDCLKALQGLANYHRKQFDIPVIALTGSNGKTSTKELLDKILSTQFNVLATEGNLNNHIGVPLTLLNLKEHHQMAIVEMGANHLDEINFLCEIAEPNYGLITNIGKAHIGEFGGYENIIKAKSELYEFLLKHDGFAFINADQEETLNYATQFDFNKKITFGQSPFSDEVAVNNENTFFCELLYNNTEIKSKLIGSYNFSNILAAITIGKYFNISFENMLSAVESYQPKNNRSEYLETEHNKIILDAYNANPSSMEAAINNFEKVKDDNKVVILGQMNELGEDTLSEHQKIVDQLIESNTINNIFLVGENYKEISGKGLQHFEDTSQLLDYIKDVKIQNSFILIKGSRTNQLEQLIDYL